MEESGSCADGWAMLNKSLIQFSAEGWGCVLTNFFYFLSFYLFLLVISQNTIL